MDTNRQSFTEYRGVPRVQLSLVQLFRCRAIVTRHNSRAPFRVVNTHFSELEIYCTMPGLL